MPDNPAQTLTNAAQILRHAAERATHQQGPRWMIGATMNRSKVVVDHPDEPTVLIETYAERLEAVNAYLTMVGPGFGLALADWLKQAADAVEGMDLDDDEPALVVARQVLGVAE